jgi:2,5-furandicarboxylate decarboxylase 1
MPKSTSSFLADLKKSLPNDLVVIEKEVDSRFEVTGILQHLESQKKCPAVLFENVKNMNGKPGNRVLSWVEGTRQRVAISLGLSPEKWKTEITAELLKRVTNRINPVVVDRKEAPVKEWIAKGEDVDLGHLPIVYHHEGDGNPYCTLPSILKKPDNIGYNIAYLRIMCRNKNETGIHMSRGMHSWSINNRNEEQGKPTPIAIVHGHHPAFLLAGVTTSPWLWDEYSVAGAMLGEPVRLTASETWGGDFLVPADAEVVIEGEIQPKIRKSEGPFGEWTGYLGPQRYEPIIRVKAITHRKNYIYQDNFIGHRDFSYTGWEVDVTRRVADTLSGNVMAVNLPYSGRCGYHVYISIKKLSEGDPMMAACAAQGVGKPKLIIIVDDDIDVFNEEEVWFAVATRFQADRDMTVIPRVRGSMLDPSMLDDVTHSTLVIDATKPVNRPFEIRVRVPQEVLDRIHLTDYIPKEILEKAPIY